MSRDITPLKEQLFRMLSSKGYQPKIVDTSNKEVQVPEEADLIRFIFTKDGKKYGPVDLTIEGNSIVIYLSDGVLSSPDFPSPGAGYDDSWNGLRNHIRSWGHRFGLGLSIKNQDHLQPDMAKRHHMKTNKIAEGYYPMGKQASYNDSVPNVKIVIQHTRKIEEGEQRFRNVEKIFIENTVGERILAPTLRPGVARIYARHIAEGGLPHDDRWKHLSSLVEEYTKMAGFVRATRAGQFNESAQKLVNEGINHYLSLRESLGKMTGHRGYNAYFEAWSPALMEEQIEEANLNELFVQETLDPRIENVLPILSKLHKKVNEMSEVTELAEWADRLIGEDESITSNNPVAIPEQDMAGGTEQLSLNQLATISDEALDNAYHYGRSSPGNTFGWQANLKSAAFAKQMIDKGVTDIEAISDAIHKGWNVTAKAFVQNPDQFDDTEKLKAAGKLEAKLQQREKLMNIGYTQLPDDEQEKDRVVARALLQAIKGNQGVAEGGKTSKQYWNRDSQSIGSTPDDGLTYADPDEDGVHYPDYGNTNKPPRKFRVKDNDGDTTTDSRYNRKGKLQHRISIDNESVNQGVAEGNPDYNKHSMVGKVRRGIEADNKGWEQLGNLIRANGDENAAHKALRKGNRYYNMVRGDNKTAGGFPKTTIDEQGMSEGGEKYKVKSIGTDAKGDYYISPSTGKKVYKSGVKKGDHENPKTGEHKGVNEERTETKDKEGNVIGWQDGTDWKKSKGKDPRGKVTNLSDKARRETEKAEKEKVKEGNDDLSRILTIMNHRR